MIASASNSTKTKAVRSLTRASLHLSLSPLGRYLRVETWPCLWHFCLPVSRSGPAYLQKLDNRIRSTRSGRENSLPYQWAPGPGTGKCHKVVVMAVLAVPSEASLQVQGIIPIGRLQGSHGLFLYLKLWIGTSSRLRRRTYRESSLQPSPSIAAPLQLLTLSCSFSGDLLANNSYCVLGPSGCDFFLAARLATLIPDSERKQISRDDFCDDFLRRFLFLLFSF